MKKLHKRIAAGLVLILLLGFISPVHATMDYSAFTVKKAYMPFADVPANSWFLPGIRTAYELDLMKGNSLSTFNPNGSLSVAEAVTLAVRLFETYYRITPATQTSPTGAWYQSYIDAAINHGILNGSYFSDYTAPINRTDFASIYNGLFPFTNEDILNSGVTLLDIPDVDGGTFAGEDILSMYHYGIMTGDNTLRFYPKSTITRAEVATIAARMVNPSLRKKLTLVNDTIAEKHVIRSYDWFVDQNVTGTYSAENCGPAVTSMILKWFSESNNVSAETLRSWVRPEGGWWYTDDIEGIMTNYQVPWQRKDLNNISQIIQDLDQDRIVLLCLDGYYMSDYYSAPGAGHFVIVKGYTNEGGIIRFETYNPDSRKDYYYFADNILNACLQWWPYYYAIGR